MIEASSPRIAVAGTFTAEPIAEVIDFWMRQTGDLRRTRLAPFGQVLQVLLDPSSVLLGAAAAVFLVRPSDLAASLSPSAIEAAMAELGEAARSAASRSAAPIVIALFPMPKAAPAGLDALAEKALTRTIVDAQTISIVGSDRVAELYGAVEIHDAHGDALGALPYSPAYFAAFGTALARRLHALSTPPFKVIAVDADQTLWAGVCAEDGPSGVRVEGARRSLQERLTSLRESGALLCLVSRNIEEDVRAVFESGPEMPLKWGDFAGYRIGWGEKSESLQSLATELGLGLDSFVFLDDSPIECAEVRARLPEVLTVRIPSDDAAISAALSGLWAFEPRPITSEDARRSAMSAEEQQREEQRREAPSLRTFIDGLDLTIAIEPMGGDDTPRVAQLASRVNQMRLSSGLRSASDLARALDDPSAFMRVVRVRDRFGDYGLVGAMLLATRGDALQIEALLLSCRALGRGVEDRMVAYAAALAKERESAHLDVVFQATDRNLPARMLLDRMGADLGESGPEPRVIRFNAEAIAAHRYAAEARPTPAIAAAPPPPPRPSESVASRAIALGRIAETLGSIDQVVAAMLAERAHLAAKQGDFDPPATEVERRVAAIWHDVLGATVRSKSARFFDLGGHSVAMIRVLSRLRDAFSVEVDPGAFFEAPTVGALAAAIEAALAKESATDDDLAAMLDAIEGLSDEEAAAMLSDAPAAARPAAPERTSATSALAIGMVTRSRPEAMRRAAESYLDDAIAHGRAAVLVVYDDTPDRAAHGEHRASLAQVAAARGAHVAYAASAEKAAFAKRIARESGADEDLVRFAMVPPPNLYACGSNRNAMLLDMAGGTVLSIDDDTLANLRNAPAASPGVDLVSGVDPADYWFFADHAAAAERNDDGAADVMGRHAAVLGKTIDALRQGGPNAAHEERLPERLKRGATKARVTTSGLAGDCGWGAPFGYWTAPMGYLSFRGASRERLLAPESAYEGRWTSRSLRRVVPRLTLSDATFGMSTFWGLDATSLLPPFFPAGRGADVLFAIAAWNACDDLCFAHLPFTLEHRPARSRRFWPGEMKRTAAGIDLCRVVSECFRAHEREPRAGDVAAEIVSLGRTLSAIASQPAADFDAFLRAQLARSNAELLAFLDAQATGFGPCPEAWVRDVRDYQKLLTESQTRSDYSVPLDLIDHGDEARALETAQRLVLRYGELLVAWPAIFEAARRLSAAGERLSQPA